MRIREILLEYNRAVTAKQVGDRVIDSLHKDKSLDLPYSLINIAQPSFQAKKGAISATPEQTQEWIETILAEIEARDPTPNNAYTPWLAKMYAKGGLKLEDINRGNLLAIYTIGKRRRMIRAEHADINRFKTYEQFEHTMWTQYSLDEIQGSEQKKQEEQGKSRKVYQDNNVLVVVPEDEAAACRYGKGTRWCTAATSGKNYFDDYNKNGSLYILIPTNPEDKLEKYQLHFESNSYMDENDHHVNIFKLLTKRFPGLLDFFRKQEPEINDKVIFAPDEVINAAVSAIAEVAEEYIWEYLSNWETSCAPRAAQAPATIFNH